MSLSYMEEQRKQGEAGIKVLKRRLGDLRTKVVRRRNQITGTTPQWVEDAEAAAQPAEAPTASPPTNAKGKASASKAEAKAKKNRKAASSLMLSPSAGRLSHHLNDLNFLMKNGGLGLTEEALLQHSLSAQLMRGRKDPKSDMVMALSTPERSLKASISAPLLNSFASQSKGGSQGSRRNMLGRKGNSRSRQSDKSVPPHHKQSGGIPYKSAMLKKEKPAENMNKATRELAAFQEGNDEDRVVESLTYSRTLEASFKLGMGYELEEAMKHAHIRAKSRFLYEKSVRCKIMSSLAGKLFWFTFCKYFQDGSEPEQDTLVVDISRTYTALSYKLLSIFPPDLSRSVVRADKDSFLGFLPFLLAEAIFNTYLAVFPGSKSYFDLSFRDRLDISMTLLLGGVQICATTQTRQRSKIFRTDLHAQKLRAEKEAERDDSDDDGYDAAQKKAEIRRREAIARQHAEEMRALPLQQERTQEERERRARRKHRRMRPVTVKFNTNLLTPVLQRGLERWTAIPTWKANRLISHAMPQNEFLLGGESTFQELLSQPRKDYQNKLIRNCKDVRQLQERIQEGREESAEDRKDMQTRQILREQNRLRALRLSMSPAHFYTKRRENPFAATTVPPSSQEQGQEAPNPLSQTAPAGSLVSFTVMEPNGTAEDTAEGEQGQGQAAE